MSETIQDDIAEALRDFMCELSEQCWCAGWQDGCERDLYRIAFKDASLSWGFGEVRPDQAAKLRRLAEASESWWYWPAYSESDKRITLATAASLFGDGDG